jgi:hypothetical protein
LFVALATSIQNWHEHPATEVDRKYVQFLLESTAEQAEDVFTRLRTHMGTPGEVTTLVVPMMVELLRDVDAELKVLEEKGDEPRSV